MLFLLDLEPKKKLTYIDQKITPDWFEDMAYKTYVRTILDSLSRGKLKVQIVLQDTEGWFEDMVCKTYLRTILDIYSKFIISTPSLYIYNTWYPWEYMTLNRTRIFSCGKLKVHLVLQDMEG